MRLFRSQPRISLAGADQAAAIAGLYSRAWEELRGKLDERLIADQTPGSEEVAAWTKGGFEGFTATVDGVLAGVRAWWERGGRCSSAGVSERWADPEAGAVYWQLRGLPSF